MEADVVVIGSGIGGLTAAAVLAKSQGKRVVVVERHFTPGGQTHSFVRGPYRWDVGLHYISTLEASNGRAWMDYITDKQVAWAPLPAAYDRFVYPDVTFAVPSGRDTLRDKLVEAFPHERGGIHTYFDDVAYVANAYIMLALIATAPPALAWAVRWWYARALRLCTLTTGAYLDGVIADVQLRRVLLSQWGDYGIPPHASAFALHSLVVSSFFEGATVPVGGAGRLFETIEAVIERYGGFTIVNHEVVAIRTVADAGGYRATGVTVRDRAAAPGQTFDITAPVVISDAGIQVTYGQLLKEPRLFESELQQIAGMVGNSAITVFVGFKESPAQLGVHGENWWMYDTVSDHDRVFEGALASLAHGPMANHAFASFPSLKGSQTSGSEADHHHVASLTAFVPFDAFRRFAASQWRRRPAEYEALKARMGQHLLALAEKYLPGFGALVDYVEVATPLTYVDMLHRDSGWFYGAPVTPETLRLRSHACVTPVAGLFLAGADVASPGIIGAAFGGVLAAGAVRGGISGLAMTFAAIQRNTAAPRSPPRSVAGGAAAAHGRAAVELVRKDLVAPQTYFLELRVAAPIAVTAGQYIQLQVAPGTYRSYSIAAYDPDHRLLGLLISTRPGGPGSVYVDACQVGDTTAVWTPMGTFTLAPGATRRLLLVGTGTGLAPLLLMANRALQAAPAASAPSRVTLLFGCRTREDDYALAMLQRCCPSVWQHVDVHVCVSRPGADGGGGGSFFRGRVTDRLREVTARTGEIDLAATDAYLCGNLHMINEVRTILAAAGAERVFTETF